MTHGEIAARLRQIAHDKPTDIWRELYALAVELEVEPDIEALVRATQPQPAQPRRGLFLLPWRRR